MNDGKNGELSQMVGQHVVCGRCHEPLVDWIRSSGRVTILDCVNPSCGKRYFDVARRVLASTRKVPYPEPLNGEWKDIEIAPDPITGELSEWLKHGNVHVGQLFGAELCVFDSTYRGDVEAAFHIPSNDQGVTSGKIRPLATFVVHPRE